MLIEHICGMHHFLTGRPAVLAALSARRRGEWPLLNGTYSYWEIEFRSNLSYKMTVGYIRKTNAIANGKLFTSEPH